MFRPNRECDVQLPSGHDVYGNAQLGAPTTYPCSIVKMDIERMKTSVRADSSGSRGNADESAAKGRILFQPNVPIEQGAICTFQDLGIAVEIISVQPRIHIFGDLDHYECDVMIARDN